MVDVPFFTDTISTRTILLLQDTGHVQQAEC